MRYITVTEIDYDGKKTEIASIFEDGEEVIISGSKNNQEFLEKLIDGIKFGDIPVMFSNLSRLIFSEIKKEGD